MIKIINKFLLAGDKLMPKLHLKQPGFTYRACFAHDAAYSDSKGLLKRTISDNMLKDRLSEIAINWKYDRYQRALASMVYKFLDQKTGSVVSVNEQL